MTTIRLAYPSGKYWEVDAHVVGPLAVHKRHPARNTSWCVTHVRTGATVIGTSARATYRQAMKIARECSGVDWEFGDFGVVQQSDVCLVAREAIKVAGARAGLDLRVAKPAVGSMLRSKRVKRT